MNCEICLDSLPDVFLLVVENHCNDVVRRMVVVFTEITGFIYENAEFLQYLSPL